MKVFVCILFLGVYATNWSQNLLANGDFETYSSLPTNVMQSAFCTGWSDCNQGGGGSPDYFHTNGSGLVQLPNSFYATIQPHGGNAIMGIIAYHGVSTDFREYISHPLSTPLVVGATYQLTYWISNGHYNGNYGGSACNNIGVAFTSVEPQQSGTLPLSTLVPQFVESNLVYDTSWTQLSYTFNADSAYQFITIGNFQNNANTLVQNIENHPIELAYYFMDDITLQRIDGNEGLEESIAAKNPLQFNPESMQIHLKTPTNTSSNLIVWNAIGGVVLAEEVDQTADFDLSTWMNGLYYYQLNTASGSVYTGKILRIF
ncbi:MAG: hypothetical protein RLZZ301_1340 [Bacteroidota bacterium]|jgi:hypothetical protein